MNKIQKLIIQDNLIFLYQEKKKMIKKEQDHSNFLNSLAPEELERYNSIVGKFKYEENSNKVDLSEVPIEDLKFLKIIFVKNNYKG